jgi:predicted nucleic acid-binding protein
MNLVDTSGWIEYFFEGPNAAFFAPPIELIEELIVPTVCLYEAFKKISVVADQSRALRAIAQMKQARAIDLTADIAVKAALISTERKLPMADGLIYATARAERATVWTQDEHFEGLPDVQYRKAQGRGSAEQ